MEPLCFQIAKDMLEVDVLPSDLKIKIREVERLVQKIKPNGCVSSTQTIATIILMWELEKLVRKYS